MVLCFFVAYISLIAFSLAATNRAPVRNNESLILTDFSNGDEIENVPYGNHSFRSVLKENYVLHVPVSFMSGESFHVKYKATLLNASKAEIITSLAAGEYDMSSCSFTTVLDEGENLIEGDLYFDGINHPQTGEIYIYSVDPGIEIAITKPDFRRVEDKRIGYLAYTALGLTVVFLFMGIITLIIDIRWAKIKS